VSKIKVYSPVQVLVGSFVGGPFAAVFVLWRNFLALGNTVGATQTIIWGTLLALLVFVALPFLPEKFPNSAIPVAYAATAYLVAQQCQISKEDITKSGQYELRSNWNVLGVSLGFLLASFSVVMVWLFLLDRIGVVRL
jgi:hypothetical protein